MNVVVLSHLRYDSVTQRPHHIVSELSKKYGWNVLFVEEPIELDIKRKIHIHIHYKEQNLAVFTPYMRWDEWDHMAKYYAEHLTHFMEVSSGETLLWFYSPHYVSILEYLEPSLVVYDCMDELAAFKNASPDLPEYEARLLAQADVVFTGGTSLYEKRKKLHPFVFHFPSSVDSTHFFEARKKGKSKPSDIEAISNPIAGYYGVLDERLDLHLIESLADAAPEISFVFIGPTAKISIDDLPVRPNIYYLGGKPYSQLPDYLRWFDVAIMPFAINSATRYISPTKTLEFMAAHKPIVSTPIKDVVRHFNQVVSIADSAPEFLAALNESLQETPLNKKRRIRLQENIIKKTSWSSTVSQMVSIIQTLQKKSDVFSVPMYSTP
jgi:hypothetical protein